MSATTQHSRQTGAVDWQMPRIDRDRRWLTGTAAGIAREIGVQPLVIRAALLVLLPAGGFIGLAYLAAWVAMERAGDDDAYVPQPKGATTAQRHIGVGLVVLGSLLLLQAIGFGFVGNLVWPAGFVLGGGLIAWTRLDLDDDRNGQGLSAAVRMFAGLVVAIGGILAFGAIQFQFRDAVLVLILSLAVIAGVAVIIGPSLLRIGTELDTARQDRVRADERARFAAHLHDSVLQTLSLIQRHADDPDTTSALARRQERELRNWLYHSAAQVGYVRLSHALNDIASQIEGDHRVPVEVVVVGDEAIETMADGNLEALLGATREAITNAAKHSGAPRVDVFAELRRVSDDGLVQAEVFVRDTGAGFERSTIDPQRRGIVDSVEGRMERHGGSAAIHSAEGEGTEVELQIQLTERSMDEDMTA